MSLLCFLRKVSGEWNDARADTSPQCSYDCRKVRLARIYVSSEVLITISTNEVIVMNIVKNLCLACLYVYMVKFNTYELIHFRMNGELLSLC